MKKIQEYFEMALQNEDDEKLNKFAVQLSALDKELGGINPEEKLNLGDLKRMARFQNMMEDYERAIITGKAEEDLAKLQAKAAPLAPKDFNFAEFRRRFQLQRVFQEYYRAVTGKGGESKSEELAKKLETTSSDDAEALNDMAWTLLTDEKIQHRNIKLALKLAQAAVDASDGKDFSAVDTFARALFDTGKLAEAVKQQKRALELCDNKDKKPELQTTLKKYEEKASTK